VTSTATSFEARKRARTAGLRRHKAQPIDTAVRRGDMKLRPVYTALGASALFAVFAIAGSGSAGSDAPGSQGLGPSGTRVYSECPATHNPKSGEGDGLPFKGYTDESNVRIVAIRSREQLEKGFPGISDVRVIPRNGQVWSYDASGQVLVEDAADFEIEVQLRSAFDCPTMPWVWGGIPLQFVTPE
jgi:hypothetical protein